MMKRIQIAGVTAAALAAAAILFAPAVLAQRPPGPPPGIDRYHDDGYRDDRGGFDWRRDGNFFQRAQETCSRMAIQEAWRRGAYSAQYDGRPIVTDGRRGPEMRGNVRVHDRSGYHNGGTVCELRRGGVATSFRYLR